MKYFLHDSNSFNDEKITELFLAHGYEGLGLFYTILEKLSLQEKPIKTIVLKAQLKVGKHLDKVWEYLEQIELISSNNGETFSKQLLNYCQNYTIKKEKNTKRIAEWRKNQQVTDDVTCYKSVRNTAQVNISKVNINTPIIPIGDEPDLDAIDFNALGANFNTKLSMHLPKVTLPMTEGRKSAVRCRIKEHGKDGVKEMMHIVLNCPHLLGDNDRGWKASFDWLFKSANFTKVIEGNYLKNERNGNTPAVSNSQDPTVRNVAGRNDAQGRRTSVDNVKDLAAAILSGHET